MTEKKADWKQYVRRHLSPIRLSAERELEIVEELAQFLDDRYQELLSGGATPEEASRAALAELSDSHLLARELRQVERLMPREPVVLGARRRNMIWDLWQVSRSMWQAIMPALIYLTLE